MGKLEDYDQIMQEQVAAGIMEPVPSHQTGEVVHYIPHQAVIREEAETTKMRIVYDQGPTRRPHLSMIVWRLDRHYSLSCLTFFSRTGCGNTALPETFRSRFS